MKPFICCTIFAIIGIWQPIVAQSLGAQEGDPSATRAQPLGGDKTAPTITTTQIESELETLELDKTIDETVKASLRQTFEQALKGLETAAGFATKEQEYREALRTGAETVAQLRNELAGLEDRKVDDSEISGGTEQLQSELEAQGVALKVARDQLEALRAEASRTESRILQIPTRMAEVQRELSKVGQALVSPDLTEAGESMSVRAEKLLLQAKQAELSNELEMLEQEQLSQSIREDLLAARRELLARQITVAESSMARLTKAVNERLSNLAERVRSVAQSVPEESLSEDATAQAVREEVLAFATDVEAALTVGAQLQKAEEELRSGREALAAEFLNIREQLELSGGGNAIVQLLFDLDRRCFRIQSEYRRSNLPALEKFRIAALRVREDLRKQAEYEEQLDMELPEELTELVEARRLVLEELGRQYSSLTRASATTDKERRKYLDQAIEVRDYIAEQLFGFGLKSCSTFGPDSLRELPGAVAWLFQPAHWREVGNGLISGIRLRPIISLAIAILFAGLLVFRSRFMTELDQTGKQIRRISKDRYQNTFRALLWTILLALPFPIAIGYASWLLEQVPERSDWLAGFQAGLQRATWMILIVCLVLSTLRRNGIGDRHFGWNAEFIDRLRLAIRRIAIVYIPAFIITIGCTYGDASLYLQSLGRISFMLANLWLAFQMFRLFHFSPHLRVDTGEDGEKTGVFLRWRPAWLTLLCIAPLGFVIMMTLGYVITSIIFSLALLTTLVIIASGLLLHGFALRWLSIKQRRLALQEAIERRRAHGENEPEVPTEIVDVEPEDANEFDLDQVAGQTRKLLRAMISLLVLVAVLAFWSQAFPIVDLAGSVAIPFLGGLTVLRLFVAIIIAVVTFVVVKNLPGFLESAILRSKDTVPGTRLAIYTLCQYGVTALGVWLFLNALHIDWAQFGWAVAALSVGIGFGLQEVVANFVCGLILLFERPIRVGDIVTVESTTGTVSKIHLRATTITNWDRQEFVVPNKTLITSTLLNWTLSAPLNRVVIPVGVAYGSDTELARKILLSVSADHPNVLDSPQPLATFEQFADSSLNIVLRVYLPDLDARLSTISELHTEINRRFAEAGIEIAFPQRDLHLRSGWLPSASNLQPEVVEEGLRSTETSASS